MRTDNTDSSYPGKKFPLRGNMIFKVNRPANDSDVSECVFYHWKPNFYRENCSEAYVYNTKFVIDPSSHIRAYGLPLGLYNITCGKATTRVRLQMQSYKKITVLNMDRD